MSSYLEDKQRRIAQFAQYLRLMRQRTQKLAKGTCFVTFDDMAPEDADTGQLKESIAITANCLANGDSVAGSSEMVVQPSGGNGDECPRYIQFAFKRDCFYVDLPKNILFPHEADLILRHRQGFYYARNRTDLSWVRANWKDIEKWEPLQKVYLYRDEESAAEDMVFIMSQIWKFPVDWRWYVTAGVFHSGRRFEWGKRMD